MRRLLLIALPLAALGCYHDNASPFVHGAKNAPSRGGSTRVSASSTKTDTTATTYGASSGYAGAINKPTDAGSVPPPTGTAKP